MALEIPEGTEKNPNLKLAQWKFCLENNYEGEDLTAVYSQAELVKILLDEIKKNNMAPFYDTLCASLQQNQPEVLKLIKLDENQVDQMRELNRTKILEMDRIIEDAEKNLSEMEVRESCLKKSEYLSIIGDKEGAITAFRKTYEKTVSLGQRLDVVFHLIRIGLFYMDHELIKTNIDKAKTLIDEGGDWDRRNRLKIYHGTYYMAIRDFKSAADLFLETISTFTSVELMDYIEFVKYTVIVAMIALPRKGIQEQIIKGSEIQEVLHGQPLLREFLMSLYECRYDVFFSQLAAVETKLKQDRLLTNHYHFYVREMRIKAYGQLLESYSSLTLSYMAKSFGVSEKFIDDELYRFIAAGRLHCKIDKVEGQVETNRPDNKNWQYQNTIKQGDILLNRIQKLSRVINI